MESKNDVYVISLDAVDLNCLPISQKSNEGRVVPLGSESYLDSRSNEYYEFEIKTNDIKAERNDQDIEDVICHICDINVPKLYFNEHKNSFRHKFNVKIADIALRRLQFFINKDDFSESNRKIPSKHYCSECSLVIDSDDEISHKQSIVHRNSIFLERFLNDFLKFYTNDENEIDDSKKDSKKIEVATDTKHCEDSKQGFDSDKLNISETVIISDSKEDSTKFEVAKEAKGCEGSKKDFNSDKISISETVKINDPKEVSTKIEVLKEAKHCEDSKQGFDSDKLNVSETVVISDSKEDSTKFEVAKEAKGCEGSKKDFNSDKISISETVKINDPKEVSTKIEVSEEAKHCEDSKQGFDSDKLNISETVIISDSKEDSTKFEVAKEAKHCEDFKKGFDSDKLNVSETVKINDPKEYSTKIEVAKETKHSVDSKKDVNSDDSSSILLKPLQVQDEVVFETVDGGRFKATEVSFNALMNIVFVLEYCMICHEFFAIEDRSLHLNSDLHRKYLLKKLPDKNCIRKINKIQNHCILCHNYFNNYEVHIHSKEHKRNFENMILPDKCKKTAPSNNKTVSNNLKILPSTSFSDNITKKSFCDFCNLWISKENLYQHCNTMGHTLAYLKFQQKQENDKIETDNHFNVELGETIGPDNAFDNKIVDAVNGKALETVDKFDHLSVPIIDPIPDKDIRTYQPTSVNEINETAEQSENTVKPWSNYYYYFCNECQAYVLVLCTT